jgi:phenylacetate-CoA ligase
MTTLAEEQAAQSQWRLRPEHAQNTYCDRLVRHEFLPPAQHRAWQDRTLQEVLRFAVTQAPFYQRMFAERGLTPGQVRGVDDLPLLPLVTKLDVIHREQEFCARALPARESVRGAFTSTGTTGRQTRVWKTARANAMYTQLTQRHYRWFRFEPQETMAYIQQAVSFPRAADGSELGRGQTHTDTGWRWVSVLYHTGPAVGFLRSNPVEQQIAWLRIHRPAYLVCMPTSAEELAFACGAERPVDSLRGIHAIGAQVTDAMRQRIEQTFGAPLHQSYGLNEIGVVAARCDAGRYHVHTECCIVEIVDDEGRPCGDGEVGRIVVTALDNLAMPLVRYDTDDLARVVSSPCPCGRTSPTFGEIAGRYRRYALLPPNTRERVRTISDGLRSMPAEHALHLRRYQVHQYRDNRLELRVVAAQPLPDGFHDHVQRVWMESYGREAGPLPIVRVEHIPPSPGGKPQDFNSDFYERPEADATP